MDLDSIPWQKLTHAYGSAEDVPDLLRALRTAPPNGAGEESPLWHLFGNIWHQGTVYEATAYAVPFLIEIIQERQTPDRVHILLLLAAIASGSSYLAVHGDILKDPDFVEKKDRELVWVRKAHEAVASGFETFVALTHGEGDICLAAAHVLAQLPEHGKNVSALLLDLLKKETDSLRRAGFMLLLGQAAYRSDLILSALYAALNGTDRRQRRAATFAISRLNPQPLPDPAREAVKEAIAAGDLEDLFLGLPWDVSAEVRQEDLYVGLDSTGRAEVAEQCILTIESGNTTDHVVSTLLDLLFPFRPVAGREPLKASDLTPLQTRTVRAMAHAMKGGRRIFYGSFPQWGLPDTVREWRDLAAGCEPTPIDLSLPILADPEKPRRALSPARLKPGQRVLHRTFGFGTVVETKPFQSGRKLLKVQFDEEGVKNLVL